MDPWPALVTATLRRHGVADPDLAEICGISANRFYRRTAREGWDAPAPRVRVHPAAGPSTQRLLLEVCASTGGPAAASHETAAWLHGLRRRPPERSTILTPYSVLLPTRGRVDTRRARWLEDTDLTEIDEVPTLAVPAMFVSLASLPAETLWHRLIDAVHRGLTTPTELLDRLSTVGSVVGRGRLREQCQRLASLRIESRFQDDVAAELERRGYGAQRSTRRIETADGVGLEVDVPLPAWQIAVEPDGDTYHRTREQRRVDRRREAAFAGIDWVRVPIDWRDWHLDREHVIAAIDAAIVAQQRRGIGRSTPLPER